MALQTIANSVRDPLLNVDLVLQEIAAPYEGIITARSSTRSDITSVAPSSN